MSVRSLRLANGRSLVIGPLGPSFPIAGRKSMGGAGAAGWSLAIPEIREDYSQGRLRTHYGAAEALQNDPAADDRFQSSLAGGRPLVTVTEPSGPNVYRTYRAQNDSSFARYERMQPGQPFRWRVLSTTGTVMTFGQATRTPGCADTMRRVDAGLRSGELRLRGAAPPGLILRSLTPVR